MKDYYDYFPKDYLEPFESSIINNLQKGENTLVSGPIGFGLKTFCNLLLKNMCLKDLEVVFIDPSLSSKNSALESVSKLQKVTKTTVVAIRYIDDFEKSDFEKLYSLQFTNRKITYLCFSHLEPLKSPLKYSAYTDNFFKRVEILKSFNFEMTCKEIAVLCDYFDLRISKQDYKKINELTGGVPRLIKYTCLAINKGDFKFTTSNLQNLYFDQAILFQLDYLRNLLYTESTSLLTRLGVLNEQGKITSLLLKDYFIKYIPEQLKTEFPNLSDYELKILSFLYININNSVSFEKIGDLINMNEYNYSLWAVYKQISRIKSKIKNKYALENVRSYGYQLKEA